MFNLTVWNGDSPIEISGIKQGKYLALKITVGAETLDLSIDAGAKAPNSDTIPIAELVLDNGTNPIKFRADLENNNHEEYISLFLNTGDWEDCITTHIG